MTVASVSTMTNRHWVRNGTGEPPDFFYPSKTTYPHLHMSTSFTGGTMNAPWDVSYIGYHTSSSAQTVIYNRANGTNDTTIIATLQGNIQAEANFAHGLI